MNDKAELIIQMCGGQAVNYLVYNWPGKTEIKKGLSAATVEKKNPKTIKNERDWRNICAYSGTLTSPMTAH